MTPSRPSPKVERAGTAPYASSYHDRMLQIAEEMFDEDQGSIDFRHWTRAELEEYCRNAAELAELVLEVYTGNA